MVSTDCGGPATAVVENKTGYLTTPGDAIALARKVKFLLENPSLRYEMGQMARKVAQARFSLEVAGGVYLQKYEELLDLGS